MKTQPKNSSGVAAMTISVTVVLVVCLVLGFLWARWSRSQKSAIDDAKYDQLKSQIESFGG